MGDNYGYAASAFAISGYQQFEWTLNDGKFDHTRDAALNLFYGTLTPKNDQKGPTADIHSAACKDKASDGVENFFLKWGTQNINGDPPAGCQLTEVVQNCNVEGGLTNC